MAGYILTFGSCPANQAEIVEEMTLPSCHARLLRGVTALWLNKFSET